MPETASIADASTTTEQKPATSRPWKRQEGESTLWFNRYCIYMDLGPKRSIQAALEQERSKIKALKSTTAPPLPTKPAKTAEKKQGKKAIAEVPKPKPVLVPGSWKQAAVTWQWVRRAQAWDTHVIESSVEKNLQNFLEHNATFPHQRIQILHSMLDSLSKTYNSGPAMTYEQDCMFVARMQAILRDIRDEMRIYNEPLARLVVRQQVEELYKDMDKYDLEEIEREQARRKATKKISM